MLLRDDYRKRVLEKPMQLQLPPIFFLYIRILFYSF